MSSVIDVPRDTRFAETASDLGEAAGTFFKERRRKQLEKKFDEAFDLINASPDYDTAIKNLGSVDPALLTNKEAIGMLTDQITRKFPEQESMEVVNAEGKIQNINYRKGQPPSDEDLAKRGLQSKKAAGIGSYISFDETTGEADFRENVKKDAVDKEFPGRLNVGVEDADSAAALKNAFANTLSARAQMKAAGTSGSKDKPTQFDQEVAATAQRLGLNVNDPEQRNRAINVKQNYEPANRSYDSLLTKSVGDQIVLTAPDTAGAVAAGRTYIEGALANEYSPAEAAQAGYAAFAWEALGNPAITENPMFGKKTKTRLESEFTTITGFPANDPLLRNAAKQANNELQDGEVGSMDILDKNGKVVGQVTFAKMGGSVVPIAGNR